MSELALFLIIAVVSLYSAIGAMFGVWLAYRNRGGEQ